MRVLVLVIGILAMWLWVAFNVFASQPAFEDPATPLPMADSSTSPYYDTQVHTRDHPETGTWDDHMAAEHGSACQAPPATHDLFDLHQSVFICKKHVMTAGFARGYGELVVTPAEVLDCSVFCSVTWEQSTARLSSRDWPDIWLTPWNDNLALPFGIGDDIDLQGVPRRGIHIDANPAENGWRPFTIDNYVETPVVAFWQHSMNQDIAAGVNQAAVRQTYVLTIHAGKIKLERLASATAPEFIWTGFCDSQGQNCQYGEADCSCLLASDYVVQFAQHSYNPTKDNAGVPATWHWFADTGPVLSPSTPFTLIHASPTLVTQSNTLVQFNAPAPANAYLRFSAVCQVKIDGNVAPKMTFRGHLEHASSYFIPIAAGKQSVNVELADEGGGVACAAQDFAIWAKAGGAPLTPTPTPITATPNPPPSPTPSFTPVPTATSTVVPTATSTPSPVPTSTPLPPTPTATTFPPTATPIRYCSTDGGNTIVKVAC